MILDQFKLDGKVAVVTGSRRNLGKSMAIGLAEAGADIIGFDRNEPEDTCRQVEALGRKYRWIKIDLLTATPADIQAAVDQAVATFGHLDILVNNAGICPRAPVLEFPEQYWRDTLQVNLFSVWFLSQAAARYMEKQGHGKIINIASLLSHQGGTIVPAYTAAKHGVLGLTKALSNDLAPKNINVNSITPGYMHTDLTEPLVNNPKFNLEARMPLGRWGKGDDLKGAVVFLASDASAYVTGADVAVDGGWLAW